MILMKILLWASGVSLLICFATALLYEGLAVAGIGGQPVISTIVEGWIRNHALLASILAGIVIGFIAWDVIHWGSSSFMIRPNG